MKKISPILYITILYLTVTSLGIYLASRIIPGIISGELLPAVADPDSLGSSIQIFLYIMVMTAVLLLLIKLKKDFIIQAVAYVALFGGTYITLSILSPTYGLVFATALTLLAFWKKQNLLIINLTLILTVAGVGAFFGSSLSTLPAILLLAILSIYDLIAVFYTKHMVTLAEKTKGKMPFMFLIPAKERNLGLGAGDLAIPLIFTVTVFKDYATFNALTTALGGLAGLILLFQYVKSKKNITLPALPPITLGLITGFALSLLKPN